MDVKLLLRVVQHSFSCALGALIAVSWFSAPVFGQLAPQPASSISAKTKPRSQNCYSIGQTIRVVGQVVNGVNSGSDLELVEAICVNYPDAQNAQTASHLSTVRRDASAFRGFLLQHLPAGAYWEVTGELIDGYEGGTGGFDIHVTTARNVTQEVNAAITAAQENCRQWQEAHRAELSAKAHGGTVDPVRNRSWETPNIACGIWTVDTAIPHASMTLWRPPSEKPAETSVADLVLSHKDMGRQVLYELPDGSFGPSDAAPVLISKVEPSYTEQAHAAKISGTVVVSFLVDTNGQPSQIQVVRPLGYGLDEKAVEAVAQWRFRPGRRAGQPVPVYSRAALTFRIL